MRRPNRRSASLIGAVAIGTVLAVAGTAVACTAYVGKLTVTGQQLTTGTASAEGNGGTHVVCASSPGNLVTPPTAGMAAAFSVAVQPSSSGCASRLLDGLYEVRLTKVNPAMPNPANGAETVLQPGVLAYTQNCNISTGYMVGTQKTVAEPYEVVGVIQVAGGTGTGNSGTIVTHGSGPNGGILGPYNVCVASANHGALNQNIGPLPNPANSAPLVTVSFV